MSVSLSPSNNLGFKRPLTTLVKRSLTITNNNAQAITFKVKTTSAKSYRVQPTLGRLEPGASIDVLITMQALEEEPLLDTKCKDKFLIQSIIIAPDNKSLSLQDIWAISEIHKEENVFQQKISVTYLPAESLTLDKNGNAVGTTSNAGTVKESAVNSRAQHKPEAHPISTTVLKQPKPVPKTPIISLNPSSALASNVRPLTTPVAFKVKTTCSKSYRVQPTLGRLEPGASIDVLFTMQKLEEEPPLDTKCKDKFLIQSAIITLDKENWMLKILYARMLPLLRTHLETDEEDKVFKEILRVTYLPDARDEQRTELFIKSISDHRRLDSYSKHSRIN
ncbi:PapD-like protein [Pholiota molesta]|nr:PapD-like protein [Pholiota molesta]